MKKIFYLALSLVVVFSLCGSGTAAESTDENHIVSFEEYEAAVIAEYAKFGIEGGVYQPTDDFYCTVAMLKDDLNAVREYAQALDALASYDSNVNWYLLNHDNEVSPHAMYIDVPCTDYYTYINMEMPILPMECKIKTTVVFRVDAQNSYIVSGGAPELEVMKGTNIDDWVELVSYDYNIDQAKRKVTALITCKLKSTLSLGAGTSWNKFEIFYPCTFYPA